MHSIRSIFFALIIFTFFIVNPAISSNKKSVSEFIFKKCQYLEQFKNISVCSTCVSSHTTIPKFYKERNYEPAWTDKKIIDELLEAIKESYDHGLNPNDYHLSSIQRLQKKIYENGSNDPSLLADFDVLLTDALLRLSFHLFYGKVSPESLDPDWNFKRKLMDEEPHIYLARILKSGKIKEALNKLSPDATYYKVLKIWLKKYREFAKHPWPLVPKGKSLRLGMSSPRVKILKKRLIAEGFLTTNEDNVTEVFDQALFEAVKAFQLHHGLEVDGVVGKNTIRALNIPPKEKVNKIRVNLERARWLLHDLPKRFLLVNIAAFKLYYFENEQKKWSCKVMVGKPYWKTPVFRATLKYIVVNPYWVVPPGILEKEIIPKIKKDISYLTRNNLEIVDLKGRPINPYSINWANINPKHFPYIIRQRPGPKNPLGRIKFIFPNKHFVFLHDTPSKKLFSRTIRAFSHGCIRVEKPLELVGILFKDSKKWNIEKIKKIIASGKNKTIYLERQIPIFILYWTVERNDDDTITFLQDIYNRDKKILIGLDTPFRVSHLKLIKEK